MNNSCTKYAVYLNVIFQVEYFRLGQLHNFENVLNEIISTMESGKRIVSCYDEI